MTLFDFRRAIALSGALKRKESNTFVDEFQMVGKPCFNQNSCEGTLFWATSQARGSGGLRIRAKRKERRQEC